MNIFVLDYNPKVAAKLHCDKHVVKMILESAQILCTVHDKLGDRVPYKATHKNHPCTLWAGASEQNYLWLYELAKALNDDFMLRFHHTEAHKSWHVIESLPSIHGRLPDTGLTPFALAMPDIYKVEITTGKYDSVESYRNYYIAEKRNIANYTWPSVRPAWLDVESHIVDLLELKLKATR